MIGYYFFFWNMYILEGNEVYFNVQYQDFIIIVGFWVFDVFFNGDGMGVLEFNDNGGIDDIIYDFDYLEDEYFYVGLIIDLDNDQV